MCDDQGRFELHQDACIRLCFCLEQFFKVLAASSYLLRYQGIDYERDNLTY